MSHLVQISLVGRTLGYLHNPYGELLSHVACLTLHMVDVGALFICSYRGLAVRCRKNWAPGLEAGGIHCTGKVLSQSFFPLELGKLVGQSK